MGIKEAYNDIKALHKDMDFHVKNQRAIMLNSPFLYNISDSMSLIQASSTLDIYKNVLEIIERECPEVKEE